MRYPTFGPGQSREAQLQAVVAAYFEAADAGIAPPREELLARYPELTAELEELLAGQEAMGRLAGAARADVDLPSPLEGRTVLGQHELLGEIGRGGMGVVYRARELRLGREVALKVISSGTLASREERQRFLREARAAARLDHPGIVPIYEVGEEDGYHYFTMKLIEGGSLASPGAGARTPLLAARLVEQVAQAVHHAHERGVLHRDLKPANILLDSDALPIVSDFGLARPLDGESSLTASGALVGTASYMAPELASAADGGAQRTADIYSLGTILYELLTGAPPFRAATPVETLRQAQGEEPHRPSQLNRAVPRDLETICLKCLEKRPERRYGTALELADDLRRFLAGEPIAARTISRSERAWRWARRHPAQSLTALFLLLAALGSMLGAVLLLGERAETRRNLAQARLLQARAGALSRRPGQRLEGLRAVREAAAIQPSLELRNAAISCLSLVDFELEDRFATGAPEVAVLALDGALKHAVWGSMQGETRVIELASGRELARLKEEPSRLVFVRFSPDDRLVLRCTSSGSSGGDLSVWRWEGTPERILHLTGQVCCQEPCFGPASDTVAFVDGAGTLQLLDIVERATVKTVPLGKKARAVLLDQAGSRASITTLDDRALVVELKEGKKLLDVPGYWIGPCHPHLDMVPVSGAAGIELWSLREQRRLRSLHGHENHVLRLTFNNAADVLISTSWDGTTRLWGLAGREILRHEAEAVVRVARDEERIGLVFMDRSAAAGKLVPAPEARTLALCEGAPADIVFGPDERWLAHGVHAGVRVLELPGGRELVAPAAGARRLLVEGTGNSLLTSGTAGLLRWPVAEQLTAEERRLRVGPPQLLSRSLPGAIGAMSLSADGRRLLVGHGYHRAVALELEGTPRVIRELSLNNATWMALSPDGTLAAVAPLHGVEACVWNVDSGALVRRLAHASSVMSAAVGFSPDGRWFYFSSVLECSMFEVGSWEKPAWTLRRAQPLGLGTPFAFSRDGELLAMTPSPKAIRLVRSSSGEELATLEEPDGGYLTDVQWSPSGRWIAAGLQGGELKLWDLLSIRRELRGLGLDWDGPPRLADAPPGDLRPLQVDVDLGPAGPTKR